MMCARLLSKHEAHPKNTRWERLKSYIRTDIWLNQLEDFYEESLKKALTKRIQVLSVAGLTSLLGLGVYVLLPSEFMPREDVGAFMIEGTAPQSSTVEFTEYHLGKMDDILSLYPEIDRRVANIINPTFDVAIDLDEKRDRTTNDIVDDLRKKLEVITGIDPNIRVLGGSGGGDSYVEFVVRGNKSYTELRDSAILVTQGLYATGKVRGVRTEMRGDNEDYTISLQRDKISTLNVEAATIAETIDALIRGSQAKTFKKDNKLYKVKVEVDLESKRTPEDITNLYIRVGEKNPTLVPMSELVSVDARSGPVEIHRHNRQRSIAVFAFLKPGFTVGEGVKMVDEIAKDVMPTDARVEFTGETRRYLTESETMKLVFGLAICFIYLVMAAQFESWRDPLIIFFSVPLSLVGGVFALGLIDNGTLNVYSFIGFVTLIGLITKHGILIVDFSNKLRSGGKDLHEAVVSAARMRLRPILMTTMAMVLGAVPLAFAMGAGHESRRQLGWVVIGGMLLGTLFTLFVVPVVYTYLSAKKRTLVNKLAAIDGSKY
jgi:multidrug efflux pump